ncbi:MAG: condensation domain-containing protein, partial [Anaerolineae bacterium]
MRSSIRSCAVTNQPLARPTGDEVFVLPTSFAQERLWFLDQLVPGSSLYSIPEALRLRGALDVEALKRGLDEIVARHESLRTTIVAVDGQPRQFVDPRASVSLAKVDLADLPPGEREARARGLVEEEARRPFDLAQGPLLRAGLLRLGEEDHVLLLNMHHIVSDEWSSGIFYRELATLYEAYCSGRPSPLPELPIQYADFAIWQRDWLQGEVLEAQLSYWREQLGGAPALLELPTDRPRLAQQTYRGAWESLSLPRGLSEPLRALGREEGATAFMTFLAAFQVLLHRYTGQEDIVVGTPIANRNRAEIEGLIGFFVNTLVLRGKLSGNPTFREFLGQVREACVGAYDHQDLPFERLVQELQPERSMSRSPVFQVMFTYQEGSGRGLELPGLKVSRMGVGGGTAKFDLGLSVVEGREGLRASVGYKTDLFDAETMRRMLGHYGRLLEGIASNGDQGVATLPLLTEGERRQMLVAWNDTRVDYPKDLCIHELFEAQVERTPDAVALVFGDREMTYGELNARANQVGHYLRGRGVGPEVLVGMCMEHCLEAVIAIVGIAKAGGAWVPLDPAYPRARVAYMVQDSGLDLVVSQARHVELVRSAGAEGCLLLDLADLPAEIVGQPSGNVEADGLSPDN